MKGVYLCVSRRVTPGLFTYASIVNIDMYTQPEATLSQKKDSEKRSDVDGDVIHY